MTPEPRDERPCWVAYATCGHMIYAAADEPEYAKDNARQVAKLIRDGYRVEKAATSDVRRSNWCPADCVRRKPKAKASATGSLFDEQA